jgi:hypothetical protein
VPPILNWGIFAGDVAQLVEQRTENPCVGGSIPSVTTTTKMLTFGLAFLAYAHSVRWEFYQELFVVLQSYDLLLGKKPPMAAR